MKTIIFITDLIFSGIIFTLIIEKDILKKISYIFSITKKEIEINIITAILGIFITILLAGQLCIVFLYQFI